MIGVILNILLVLVGAAIVLLIVDRLSLGLNVDGFGSAIIAAAVIAIIGGIIYWLLGLLGITIGGGLLGAIINLIIAAAVLMLAAGFLPGLQVAGFTGALVAAILIAIVTWVIWWLLGLLGLA